MTTATETTLLHEALPSSDVGEVHALELPVPQERAWDALRSVTPLEVRLFAPLMALRALPALLARRSWLEYGRRDSLIDLFLRNGFVELGQRPGRELAVGAIGRFWKLAGNRPVSLASAAEFIAFDTPGYAKGVMNFTLEPTGTGTLVGTETRVAGTDPGATRTFRRYWRVVRPGSALIRISALNAISRRAQSA